MSLFSLNDPTPYLLMTDDTAEMVSIVATDPDQPLTGDDAPAVLPLLAVRNTVLFPGVVLPVTVTRKKSIRLVRKAYRGDKIVGVVAQKNVQSDDPLLADLYQVGTMARILKMLVLPDGNTTIIIQGQSRFHIEEEVQDAPYLTARVSYFTEAFPNKNTKEVKGSGVLVEGRGGQDAEAQPRDSAGGAGSAGKHRLAGLSDALPVVQHQRGGRY